MHVRGGSSSSSSVLRDGPSGAAVRGPRLPARAAPAGPPARQRRRRRSGGAATAAAAAAAAAGDSGGDGDDAAARPPPAFDRRAMAAMALSPIAAVAFAASIGVQQQQDQQQQDQQQTPLQQLAAALPPGASDAARRWAAGADEAFTFMDWVPAWAGLDLQRLGWDPDLALRLKRAVELGEPRVLVNAVLDRLDLAGKVPDAGHCGDMRLSYAKFLELLAARKVKRVIVYGDLRTAVVEVPHPWTASLAGGAGQYPTFEQSGRSYAGGGDQRGPVDLRVPDPLAPSDPSRAYAPEAAEWDMDKYRFYVDLPADFWRPDSSPLLRHLREQSAAQQVVWDPAARRFLLPWEALTRVGEVGRTELQVMRPADSWAFASWLTQEPKLAFYEKAAAVCLFVRVLAVGINVLSATGFARFVARKTRKKKDKRQSQWERLTRAPAREYNPNATIPDKTKKKKKKKRKTPGAGAFARFNRNPAAALTADLDDEEDEDEGGGRSTDIKVVAKDTGVRFSDIAGMQGLVAEMRVLVKCLLGDPAYTRVGAKAPRGIIFQGPPGTGKTYLARAIAGEAGVPFLSAVGSEFIEMYSGVAAARVSALYRAAHNKAPCIVFIDEIDAIGRSRSALGGDPGSQEREQALLTMLVQMDGIHDRPGDVLTIGATNLVAELDQALLRPGRFEIVYEIPAPDPRARAEILRYHARTKQVDPALLAGGGGEGSEGGQQQQQPEGGIMVVAEATGGWSAASLANLLNEAAIVTVRRDEPCITLPLLMELVELQEWGPPTRRIPQTPAKRRLAHLTAAKAVAFALTPGIEAIDFVTMWSRKRGVGPYVQFIESDKNNVDPDWTPEKVDLLEWDTRGFQTNAARVDPGPERLGELLHVASLLLPLYAPRIFEVWEYGPDGASLATSAGLGDAFDLAYYCARQSSAHPRYRRMPPFHTHMRLGMDPSGAEQRDILSLRLDEELGYHRVALTMLKAAYRRAEALVATRRTAIRRVAEEMLAAEDERMSGARLVEIIETTPPDAHDIKIDSDFMPVVKQVLGRVPGVIAAADGQLRLKRKRKARPPSPLAPSPAPSAPAPASEASSAGALASFAAADGGAGRSGAASFRPAVRLDSSSTSSSGDRAGRQGAGAGAGDGAEAEAEDEDVVRLDDETLRAVARAVLGRTDVRDLIGSATAYDAAERVRDALLDPRTLERVLAVRRYVEDAAADFGRGASGDSPEGAARGSVPFPPEPLAEDVPQPVYGAVWAPLEGWVRRARSSVVTASALDLLYTDRQRQLYASDLPDNVGKTLPLPGQEGWVDPADAADDDDDGGGGGGEGGSGGGGGGGRGGAGGGGDGGGSGGAAAQAAAASTAPASR